MEYKFEPFVESPDIRLRRQLEEGHKTIEPDHGPKLTRTEKYHLSKMKVEDRLRFLREKQLEVTS